MFRKTISVILSIVMCISLLEGVSPLTSLAAGDTPADYGWSSDGTDYTDWTTTDANNFAISYNGTNNQRVWRSVITDTDNFTVSAQVAVGDGARAYIKILDTAVELNCSGGNGSQIYNNQAGAWFDAADRECGVTISREDGGDVNVTLTGKDNETPVETTLTPGDAAKTDLELGVYDSGNTASFTSLSVTSGMTPADYGWSSDGTDYMGWTATDADNFTVNYNGTNNHRVWDSLITDTDNFTVSAQVTVGDGARAYIKILDTAVELSCSGGNGSQIYNNQAGAWFDAADRECAVTISREDGGDVNVTLTGKDNETPVETTLTPGDETATNMELGVYDSCNTASFTGLSVTSSKTPADYGWSSDDSADYTGWTTTDAENFTVSYNGSSSRRVWKSLITNTSSFTVSVHVAVGERARAYVKIMDTAIDLQRNDSGNYAHLYNSQSDGWFNAADGECDVTVTRTNGGTISVTLTGKDNETPVETTLTPTTEDKTDLELGVEADSGSVRTAAFTDITVTTGGSNVDDGTDDVPADGTEFAFTGSGWTSGKNSTQGVWAKSAQSDNTSAASYIAAGLSGTWACNATAAPVSNNNSGRAVSKVQLLDKYWNPKVILTYEAISSSGQMQLTLQYYNGTDWVEAWKAGSDWVTAADTAVNFRFDRASDTSVTLTVTGNKGYTASETVSGIPSDVIAALRYMGLAAEKTTTTFFDIFTVSSSASDYAAAAATAYTNLKTNYVDTSNNRLYPVIFGYRDGDTTNTGFTISGITDLGSLWEAAILLQALDTYYNAISDSGTRAEIAAIIANTVNHFNATYTEAQITTAADNTINAAMDDCGWNVEALLLGYQYNTLLGNAAEAATCLDYATKLFNSSYNTFYDSALGGGMWYNTGKAVKSLYAATLALAGYDLFQITDSADIQSRCTAIYNGVEDNLRRNDGLYWISEKADGTYEGASSPYDIGEGGSCTYIGGNMCMAILNARLGNDDLARQTAQAISLYETTSAGALLNDRDAWNNTFFLGRFVSEVVESGIACSGFGALVRITADKILTNAVFDSGYYSAAWEGPQEPDENGYPSDYSGTRNNWGSQQNKNGEGEAYCTGSTPKQIMTSATTAHVLLAAALLEADTSESTAELASASVSGNTLWPVFNSDITAYSIIGSAPDAAVTLSLSAAGADADVKVNDEAVTTGSATITAGTAKAVIGVTSADGKTTKTYQIAFSKSAAYTYSYADIAKRTYDMSYLATVPQEGEGGKEITSTDPTSVYNAATDTYENWSGNGDMKGYVRYNPDNGYRVLADLEGPGYLTRIWTGQDWPGKLHIWIDGELVVDTTFVDFVHGSYFSEFDELSFKSNYVDMNGYADGYQGAINCFVPITYNESCVVEIDCNVQSDFYYIVGYYDLEDGASVEPFTWPMSEENRAALKNANDILSDTAVPTGDYGYTGTVGPGQTVTLYESDTAGAISSTSLKIDIPEEEFDDQTSLVDWKIAMYWDGSETPAVYLPVADFYGNIYGLSENVFDSAGFGSAADGTMYSTWYMPFNSARITLTNESEAARAVTAVVDASALTDTQANELTRFHANWQRAIAREDDRYPDAQMLYVEGEGRYVGTTLHVYQIIDGIWWGEGDEKFFVDGEKYPTWFGTGSEDYFCYAWCGSQIFDFPYCGQPHNDGDPSDGNHQVQGHGDKMNYRVHLLDNVCFHTSFEANIEKYFNEESDKYAATSFFYLTKETSANHTQQTVTREDRLFNNDSLSGSTLFYPGAYLVSREIYTNTSASLSLQGMAGICEGVFDWYGDVQMFWQPTSKGKYVEFQINIPESGSYDVELSVTKCIDYGIFEYYLDDVLIGTADSYAAAVTQMTKTIGTMNVTKGEHILKIAAVGKNNASSGYYLGLNYIEFKAHSSGDEEPEPVSVKYRGSVDLLAALSGYTSAAAPGDQGLSTEISDDGSHLFWPADINSKANFTIEVPENGYYTVETAYTCYTDFGKFELYLDGTKIGDTYDAYDTTLSVKKAVIENVAIIAGEHTLSVKCVGKNDASAGNVLGIDYVSLDGLTTTDAITSDVGAYYRGSADLLKAMTGYSTTEAPHDQGLGTDISDDGSHLFWRSAEGDTASYTLSVPQATDYDITVAYTCFGDFGKFEVLMDGEKVGDTYDAYDTTLCVKRAVITGVNLDAGEHTLTIRCAGKNSSSAGSVLGIDYISFAGKISTEPIGEPVSVKYRGSVDLLAALSGYTSAAAPGDQGLSTEISDDGSHLFWPADINSKANFTIEVPENGYYTVETAYTCYTDFGKFELYLDGTKIGDTYDAYDTTLSVKKAVIEDVAIIAGEHTLSVKCVGRNDASAGNVLGIDYISLDGLTTTDAITSDVGAYYRGSADLLKAMTGYSTTEAPHDQGLGTDISDDGSHLFWRSAEGDTASYALSVPQATDYDITVAYTCFGDFGKFEVLMDGEKVGDTYDAYDTTLCVKRAVITGVNLDAGEHTLTIRCAGKNSSSAGSVLGIDYISFAGTLTAGGETPDFPDNSGILWSAKEAAMEILDAYAAVANEAADEYQLPRIARTVCAAKVAICQAATQEEIDTLLSDAKDEIDTIMDTAYEEELEVDELDDLFYEGADMPGWISSYSSTDAPVAQGCDPTIFSGAAHMFWQPTAVDQTLEISIDVPVEATYNAELACTVAPDYGCFDAYIDAVKIASVDAYGASINVKNETYSGLTLTAGTHTLKIVVTGKNALSPNYYIGIDHLKLISDGTELNLAMYKKAACEYLDTYKSSENYSSAQWTVVLQTIEARKALINASQTVDEVIAAWKAAKAALNAIESGLYDYDNPEFDSEKTPADFGWSTDNSNYVNWKVSASENGEPLYVEYDGVNSKRIWKEIIQDTDNFTVKMTVKVEELRAEIEIMGVHIELNCEHGNGNQIFDKESWSWFNAANQLCDVTIARAGGGDLTVKFAGSGNTTPVTFTKTPTNTSDKNVYIGVIDTGGSAFFSDIEDVGLSGQNPGDFGWDTDEIGGTKDFTGWTSVDGLTVAADYDKTTGNHRIWRGLISDQSDFIAKTTYQSNSASSAYISVLGQILELDCRGGDGNQIGVKLNGTFQEWVAATGCRADVYLSRKDGDIQISIVGSDGVHTYAMTPGASNENLELGIYAGTVTFADISVTKNSESLRQVPFGSTAFAGDFSGTWATGLCRDISEYQDYTVAAGILGDTDASNVRADLVVVSDGVNDMLAGTGAESFLAAYKTYLTEVKANQAAGSVIVVTSLPYLSDAALGDVSIAAYAAYNAGIRALADELGLIYVDIYTAMGERDWTLDATGKVLSDSGKAVVSGAVLEELMRSCSCLAVNAVSAVELTKSDEVTRTAAALSAFTSASTAAEVKTAVEDEALGLNLKLYHALSSTVQGEVCEAVLAADRSGAADFAAADALFLAETMKVSRANPRTDLSDKTIGRYVSVGDSITEGAQAVNSSTDAYAPRFAALINSLSSNGITFLNKGISGTRMCTVTDNGVYPAAKDTVDDYIVANSPDLLTIAYGINDINAGTAKTEFLDTYDDYLAEIQTKCPDTIVLVLGITANGSDANSATIREWNAGIKTLAEKYGYIYVDTYYDMRGVDWLLDDGLHPNNAGYRVMANAVLRTFNAYFDLNAATEYDLTKTPGDFGWKSDSGSFPDWQTTADGSVLKIAYSRTNGDDHRIYKALISDINNFTFKTRVKIVTTEEEERRAEIEIMGVHIELNCQGGNGNQIYDKISGNWFDAEDQTCDVTVTRVNGGDLTIIYQGVGNSTPVIYTASASRSDNNVYIGVIEADQNGTAIYSSISCGAVERITADYFGWDTDEVSGSKDYTGWLTADGVSIGGEYADMGGTHRVWKSLITDPDNYTVKVSYVGASDASAAIRIQGYTVELDGRDGGGSTLTVKGTNSTTNNTVTASGATATVYFTRKDGGDITVSVVGSGAKTVYSFTLPMDDTVSDDDKAGTDVELVSYAGTVEFNKITVSDPIENITIPSSGGGGGGSTSYTVTWIVEGQETKESYATGETPQYKGSTVKAADQLFSYTFTGWDKALVAVTGNATYTAQYIKSAKQTKSDGRFTDVSASEWYSKDVYNAVGMELFEGVTDTLFCPDSEMDRGTLVTVLWRLAGKTAPGTAGEFSDVAENAYYADAVTWAVEAGITEGVGGTKFAPEATLTREQFATFLYRFAVYEKLNTAGGADISAYPDAGGVSEFAKEAMSWAVGNGLINGCVIDGETVLSPDGDATRAQAAAILVRFVKNIMAKA